MTSKRKSYQQNRKKHFLVIVACLFGNVIYTAYEIFCWLFFKVFLPGFPFFVALFLDQFVNITLRENITIVIESDILVLGASVATSLFETTLDGYKLGKFGIITSVASLLVFLCIFCALYVPGIGFLFKSMELEKRFWLIMVIMCTVDAVLGIIADVLLPKLNIIWNLIVGGITASENSDD